MYNSYETFFTKWDRFKFWLWRTFSHEPICTLDLENRLLDRINLQISWAFEGLAENFFKEDPFLKYLKQVEAVEPLATGNALDT